MMIQLTNNQNARIVGGDQGIAVGAGGGISALVNSGSISGFNGLRTSGSIGTLTNNAAGTFQGTNIGMRFDAGTVTTLNNLGIVTTPGDWGMYADTGATIGTLTNSGTISGNNGIGSLAVTGTMRNQAGGLIQGTSNRGLALLGGSVTLLENAGSITGVNQAIRNSGTITTMSNSGTMAGSNAIEHYGSIGTFTNSGRVNGSGSWGFYQDGTLGTLTNSGTITAGNSGIGLVKATGTISNLAGGSVFGSNNGLYLSAAGSVTLLDNAGSLAGTSRGIENRGTITTGTNSGTITGNNAIEHYGSIGTFTNTGAITGNSTWGFYAEGAIGTLTNSGTIQAAGSAFRLATTGTLTNAAAGVIRSTANNAAIQVHGNTTLISNAGLISSPGSGGEFYGIDVQNGTTTEIANTGIIEGVRGIYSHFRPIGTITNSGTVQGTAYGLVGATTGTINNTATGVIRSTGASFESAVYLYGATGLFSNAGLVDGSTTFIGLWQADGVTTQLINSGTITGGTRGVSQNRTIGTLTNTATGLITSPGGDGLFTGTFDPMDVVNAGRITGARSGVYAWYGIDSLTNQSGGIISGTTGAGLYIENESGTITNQAGGVITSASNAGVFVGNNQFYGVLETLSNAGSIAGATAGVQVTTGRIGTVTNTGTIAFTGAGTGPAVLVGPGGVLGVASGSAGVALSSTGAGALLDGTIVNSGTIHHGFTIENQNVTVSAGSGTGSFSNGTLTVADGDLLFTSGVLALAADVSVDDGAGMFTNEATLALGDSQTVTGNFTQTSAATLRTILSGSSTYGALTILGAATFAGGLDLDLSAFSLAEGQTFDLLQFASRTGGFSGLSVDGTALVSLGANQWAYESLILQETWTDTSMSLSISAVPEPSTVCMALAGLACGGYSMWRRRKRA
jgi:hypothetical protein